MPVGLPVEPIAAPVTHGVGPCTEHVQLAQYALVKIMPLPRTDGRTDGLTDGRAAPPGQA
ncbi:hypothetical protein GCM10018781_50400 [Kitasatospora indigofera]|uniref:Uncharacterized protein n=1 Tax=Kitasatospora indigofera TaxID=67307 RepID=A0A919KYF9_9ACTN|nr:hypothetical protein GCM10018781_50400 [Kitasatospora indigofera]